eukprot:COSAG01_NODE_24842_length_764_cov_1.478195_1_plen_185_part_00
MRPCTLPVVSTDHAVANNAPLPCADNGAEEVLNLCVLRHDVISLVSDYVVNLSFLSLMTPFHSMPHARLAPVETTRRYNRSKAYVTLVRSDGDNLQIVTGGQRDQMTQRRQQCSTAAKSFGTDSHQYSLACPPQTWTLSNRLLEFGPGVLRWWYEQAAAIGRDDFMFGPSGEPGVSILETVHFD